MNVKIRNAVPADAAAIQKIIAAGYRRSFAGLHSTEYLEQKIQEYLSPARIEKMANIIRNENSVNIVAENAGGDVVGSVGGMRNENNNWELIEEICKKTAFNNEIWYATNIEIHDYIEAYKSLRYSADGTIVYNPTLFEIWFDVDGKLCNIKPGETIRIS